MKRIFVALFFILLAINFTLSAWYVINNDLIFSSDIARDFFLFDEIKQKKLVLIGPNSSTGLFHGPLWSYLNTPAFLLGNGNPVIVGWFWVLLTLPFIASSFYIGKKLFDSTTGYLFALMVSTYMTFHTNGMFNPHGAMLLLPAFFFTFIQYVQTKKILFAFLNFVLGGLLVQFQMAVGIPFLILSSLFIFIDIIKRKKYIHLFIFLIIPFMLSNFILFDIRHQQLLSNKLLHYITSGSRDNPNYISLAIDRLDNMLTNPEIVRRDPGNWNVVLFSIFLLFLVKQIKDNKHRDIYLSFIYFYVGFFILSFINTGIILYFYIFPLFPLIYLIFSSFITSNFKKQFLFLFIIIMVLNINTAVTEMLRENVFTGKNPYSWKFLHDRAIDIYNSGGNNFGYFVYSPNTFAYEGKYAMLYTQKEFNNRGHYFTKKPTTYILGAPPPPDNPHMQHEWWRDNKMNLRRNPDNKKSFPNGYFIEKYTLNNEEIKQPTDPTIDPGLHFR